MLFFLWFVVREGLKDQKLVSIHLSSFLKFSMTTIFMTILQFDYLECRFGFFLFIKKLFIIQKISRNNFEKKTQKYGLKFIATIFEL